MLIYLCASTRSCARLGSAIRQWGHLGFDRHSEFDYHHHPIPSLFVRFRPFCKSRITSCKIVLFHRAPFHSTPFHCASSICRAEINSPLSFELGMVIMTAGPAANVGSMISVTFIGGAGYAVSVGECFGGGGVDLMDSVGV